MVHIEIEETETTVILNCRKGGKNKERFRLIIDKETREVIGHPKNPDIDASVAYSCVYHLMKTGEPLPKETSAAWG